MHSNTCVNIKCAGALPGGAGRGVECKRDAAWSILRLMPWEWLENNSVRYLRWNWRILQATYAFTLYSSPFGIWKDFFGYSRMKMKNSCNEESSLTIRWWQVFGNYSRQTLLLLLQWHTINTWLHDQEDPKKRRETIVNNVGSWVNSIHNRYCW